MKSMDNEKLLIAKAQDGDGEAFGELVRFYERFVYNTAYGFLLSPEDAFDIAQDAFIKAWRSVKSFKGESAFSTWLYRITVNTAKDAISAKARRRELFSVDTAGNALSIPTDDTPEREYIRKEESEALRLAIDELDNASREIIVLRELDGLTYEQIALTLGLEMGTVKSRLSRAREKLVRKLGEQNETTGVKTKKRGKETRV